MGNRVLLAEVPYLGEAVLHALRGRPGTGDPVLVRRPSMRSAAARLVQVRSYAYNDTYASAELRTTMMYNNIGLF